MSVGDDAGQGEQEAGELIERQRLVEERVAGGHRQAELEMARHVVAAGSISKQEEFSFFQSHTRCVLVVSVITLEPTCCLLSNKWISSR